MTQPDNPIKEILESAAASPKVLELNLDDEPRLEEEIGVKIRGHFYPYAAVNDWSLGVRNKFASLWEQMGKLERIEDVTDADEERYRTVSGKFLQLCVPTLEEEIIGKMSPSNRTALAMDFFLKVAVRHPVFKTMAGFTSRTGTN
jgi:hypothetical protein